MAAVKHTNAEQRIVSDFNAPPSYGEATNAVVKSSLMEIQRQHFHQHALQQQRQSQRTEKVSQSLTNTTIDVPAANETAARPRIRCANGHAFPPIVIPQSTAKLTNAFLSPFARAYAPDLANVDLDQAQFVRILDELNEVFMLNPVFQCVSMAGKIASFVPEPITIGVGVGVQILSGVAGAATSYARTRAFVKRINEEVFRPRGMRLRILSTDKMMEAIGEPAKGALDRQGFVMQPLPTHDEPWDPTSAATDPRIRRVEALQGRVAALDWNVPSPNKPDSVLAKMGAWQAAKQERKEAKKHDKLCRKAGRAACRVRSVDSIDDEADQTMTKHQRKELKKPGRATKREAKYRRKSEKAIGKIEKRERKVNQRVRWIVIVPDDEALPVTPTEEEIDLGLEDDDDETLTAHSEKSLQIKD